MSKENELWDKMADLALDRFIDGKPVGWFEEIENEALKAIYGAESLPEVIEMRRTINLLKIRLRQMAIDKATKDNPENKLFLYAQFEYYEIKKTEKNKYNYKKALEEANKDPRCNFYSVKDFDKHLIEIQERFKQWRKNNRTFFNEWRTLIYQV